MGLYADRILKKIQAIGEPVKSTSTTEQTTTGVQNQANDQFPLADILFTMMLMGGFGKGDQGNPFSFLTNLFGGNNITNQLGGIEGINEDEFITALFGQ